MLRLFSFLLILIGAGALAFGGYQYMNAGSQPASVSAPPPPAIAGGFEAASIPESASKPTASRSMSKSILPDEDMFDTAMSTEDFLGSLRTVPIAHETPKGATFGRPFTVTVALDATGDDTAADALPGRGNIGEGEAKISDTVRALVSGENFDIEPITPDIQRISPLTENIWRWKVTPMAVGDQELVIELFALMGNEALPLRTFRDSVDVEVSRIGQAIALAQSISPITVVAGGIGSLLAGMFGFIGFFRRR
ncbi:MAG: hypothetical protein AAGJ68_01950 [Pseudomonadota bacterium]